MDAISKQHSQVFDDAESLLTSNPTLTLDELNAALQHKIHRRNTQPHGDFFGLSPIQVGNWLYSSLDELEGVTIHAPTDLSASPVMRYLALIIDEAIANGGKLRATSKGNLPAKLVKLASACLPEFAVADCERDLSISEFAGNNEDSFNALHYTRVLAELAGLVYRRSGHYHVKVEAQKVYRSHGVAAFFKPMLEAAIFKYNWGYFDGFDYDIDLRPFWLFMLWRLQTHKSAERLTGEVIRAFPDLMRLTPANNYSTPEKELSVLIEPRFIRRFLEFWGFVTLDPRRYVEGEPVERLVRTLPMMSETFKFSAVGS